MNLRPLRNVPPRFFRLGVACLFLAILAVLSAPQTTPVLAQATLPVDGWVVCGDLGIGPVPGESGDLQRVALCQGSGWEVQAFCIEPAKPVPVDDTVCSMVNSTDFWCGDGVQQLREYQILATPAPNTPQPTASPTPTFTRTPTTTATPQPTPTRNTTPGGSRPTTTVEAEQSTPTPFVRPHPGGPGNLGMVLSLLAILGGAGSLGLAATLYGGSRRAG
jgi:hypothetical protein